MIETKSDQGFKIYVHNKLSIESSEHDSFFGSNEDRVELFEEMEFDGQRSMDGDVLELETKRIKKVAMLSSKPVPKKKDDVPK